MVLTFGTTFENLNSNSEHTRGQTRKVSYFMKGNAVNFTLCFVLLMFTLYNKVCCVLPGLKFKEIYMIPYRINPDPIFSHQGIPRNLTSPPKNSSIRGSHLSKHISELQVVLKEHSWVHQPLVFGQLKHKHHTMRQRSDIYTHTEWG